MLAGQENVETAGDAVEACQTVGEDWMLVDKGFINLEKGELLKKWFIITFFSLMLQLSIGAGFDSFEEQFKLRSCPGKYSDFPPVIKGGSFGRIITRRSPYLLSELNIGASVLTSQR